MDYFDSRDFLTEDPLPSDESVISHFYDDANVFITGSTGFIGSLILEKLLRCCPGIKQVFILIRIKKGKTEKERLQDLFRNELFYQLWKTNPEFGNKVTLIQGDCSQPQLGMSPKDREKLLDVNVIFHSAAELRFDNHLRQSFQTNVCATHDLLELAKQMKYLKGFTYISTAYSQVIEANVKEEFYKPIYNYNEVKTIIDNCSDKEISQLMPLLLGRATTYSFTKSIAEHLIEEYKDQIPIGIVRPSVVINTDADPIIGWIGSLNGHSAIIIGLLVGFLHVLKVKGTTIADSVPGDKVASAAIASTWDYVTNKPLFPIYNITSGRKSAVSWAKLKTYIVHIGNVRSPASQNLVWEPCALYVSWSPLYKLLVILFHVIPGFIADNLLKLLKIKLSALRLYRKAAYLWHIMEVYIDIPWDFEDNQIYKVWDNMSDNDKRIFNFSMIDFDWPNYLYNYIPGVQVYTVKENLDCEGIKKARRKRNVLRVCHYILTLIFIMCVLSFVSNLMRR